MTVVRMFGNWIPLEVHTAWCNRIDTGIGCFRRGWKKNKNIDIVKYLNLVSRKCWRHFQYILQRVGECTAFFFYECWPDKVGNTVLWNFFIHDHNQMLSFVRSAAVSGKTDLFFTYSRCNLTSVSSVCELGPVSFLWAHKALNKLPDHLT